MYTTEQIYKYLDTACTEALKRLEIISRYSYQTCPLGKAFPPASPESVWRAAEAFGITYNDAAMIALGFDTRPSYPEVKGEDEFVTIGYRLYNKFLGGKVQ